MAFVKIGDAELVLDFHDGKEEVICDKCHKSKTVVAVKQENIELICECSLESELQIEKK